ncbi:hypothetical protein K458DRAFT_77488 [Lentithecium fluviatile CBS 122367]|uniref:Uncharacterized protein n=1 Tax=Lentithecium fluviatile CBS 122367 TaxID=1168545 RepID=A0A6G1ITW1_9PLEO|nr:hypothetical protein K458DRAFT_77488 [Lentithecium fluviatile CBS 122367]
MSTIRLCLTTHSVTSLVGKLLDCFQSRVLRYIDCLAFFVRLRFDSEIDPKDVSVLSTSTKLTPTSLVHKRLSVVVCGEHKEHLIAAAHRFYCSEDTQRVLADLKRNVTKSINAIINDLCDTPICERSTSDAAVKNSASNLSLLRLLVVTVRTVLAVTLVIYSPSLVKILISEMEVLARARDSSMRFSGCSNGPEI